MQEGGHIYTHLCRRVKSDNLLQVVNKSYNVADRISSSSTVQPRLTTTTDIIIKQEKWVQMYTDIHYRWGVCVSFLIIGKVYINITA